MTDATQWDGKRVRLVRCTDPWTRLKPGAMGTVLEYHPQDGPDRGPILWVKWDSGELLAMLLGAGDSVETINGEDEREDTDVS